MGDSNSKSAAYSKVVQRASLEEIRLTASSFKLSADFLAHKNAVSRFMGQATGNPHFDEKTQLLVGSVRCRVWMNKRPVPDAGVEKTADEKLTPDEKFKNSVFSIDAKYSVIFKMPGSHPHEALKVFFDKLAPLSAWPYFRTHVAHLASEAQIVVPVLPIKKLLQPVDTASDYVDPDEGADSTSQEG